MATETERTGDVYLELPTPYEAQYHWLLTGITLWSTCIVEGLHQRIRITLDYSINDDAVEREAKFSGAEEDENNDNDVQLFSLPKCRKRFLRCAHFEKHVERCKGRGE